MKNKVFFNIHGIISIRIQGDSGIVKFFSKHLSYFRSKPVHKPDIVLEVRRFEVNSEDTILGSQFIVEKDFLIINKYNTFLKTNLKDRIICYPNYPKGWILRILHYLIRINLIKKGYAILHSSAARLNDKTYLFCSWKDCGKTHLLINLLKKGALYISDEFIIVDKEGFSYLFPTDLKVTFSNFRKNDDLIHAGLFCKIRSFLFRIINKTFKGSSFFSEGVRIFNENVILPTKKINFSKFRLPKEKRTMIHRLFIVSKTDSDTKIRRMSATETSKRIIAINFNEWDHEILNYASALNFWKKSRMLDNVRGILSKERELIKEFTRRIETYDLNLSLKLETNIYDKIL